MPATAAPRVPPGDRVGSADSPADRRHPAGRRDPRTDELSPAMRRAKELAGQPPTPAARRHVKVPRLAPRSRLTSLPQPAGAERRADFLALAAVRIGATAAEVAAGRAAGAAMKAKLAALRAAKAAPQAPTPARPVSPRVARAAAPAAA